jgi:hypothetical protein
MENSNLFDITNVADLRPETQVLFKGRKLKGNTMSSKVYALFTLKKQLSVLEIIAALERKDKEYYVPKQINSALTNLSRSKKIKKILDVRPVTYELI